MRRHGLVLIGTLGLAAFAAAVAAAVAWGHPTPRIRAAQAHRRVVLAEVDRIGVKLQVLEDQAQNAEQQLSLVKQSLRPNEYRLQVAKRNLRAAQKRLMAHLYALYVSGSPSTLEVISGAHSLSQLIDRAESAQALSNEDAAIGREALSFERLVAARERRLQRLERRRERMVREVDAKKRMAASELAQQKRLLASIHTTISNLQAQEAARERAARAAAEERVRAEIAARKAARRAAEARAQRAARARAQRAAQARALRAARSRAARSKAQRAAEVRAQRAARAKAQRAARAKAQQTRRSHHSHHSSTPTLTPPPPPPPNLPVGAGAGHPAAAQIALRYLGVPYVWGGASPSGFDCSGLVMYVYAQLGISLPHYTVAQWDDTKPISSPAPGDLVFFNGLGHVGIYIGGGQFVDAPHTGSVVRIDNIAGFGSYDGARRVP